MVGENYIFSFLPTENVNIRGNCYMYNNSKTSLSGMSLYTNNIQKLENMVVLYFSVKKTADFRSFYRRPDKRPPGVSESIKEQMHNMCPCDSRSLKKSLTKRFPVWKIMKKYKWRTDLPSDIVSGLTVGIMQLPQGILVIMISFCVAPVLQSVIWRYFQLRWLRKTSCNQCNLLCIISGTNWKLSRTTDVP